jgi:lysophospholipase L1-like esterase
MKPSRKWLIFVCWLIFAALIGKAQQSALLTQREAISLYERAVQLLDSSKVAIPELARAGDPLAENCRQALATMKATGGQDAPLTFSFYTNLRAYLALSDVVPKPYPMPETVCSQFTELRGIADRIEAHFSALLRFKESQLRDPDRDELRRYAEANQKLGPPQVNKPRVVFLGDSITDGWRLNEYFPDRDFVNRGISGQITGQMLGRMKADVVDLKPAAVVILGGTNDIARGIAVPVIENNLTMIADLAEVYKIKPLFASLLPVSDYHKDRDPRYEQVKRRPLGTIQAVNNWLQEFCRRRNYTYIDYFSKLVDSAGYLAADLSDDGLHPNAAGYRRMAPVVLEAIDTAIKPASQPKKRRWPF